MLRPTRVQIDTERLRQNVATLVAANGAGSFLCTMVKANAYGHGDVIVANVLSTIPTVSALGVALVEEGLHLREAGVRAPILVFAPFAEAGASAMLTHQLTPVVSRAEDLRALRAVSGKARVGIHLKINTGMQRMGFDEEDLLLVKKSLAESPLIQVEGVCTHLSHGEDADRSDGPTARQMARFTDLAAGLPGLRHAHKSASLGVLAAKGLRKDPELGARVGISLYGLPYEGEQTAPGLRPILRWSTALIRVHKVAKGEGVSYGARWTAPRPSLIGVLPVGYGDGYLRALSNRGEMLLRGRRVPVVGSVCMDYTLVDLTDFAGDFSGDGLPQPGEEVILLGTQGKEEITAGFLAERAGTIAYEIVTLISARVAREAV